MVDTSSILASLDSDDWVNAQYLLVSREMIKWEKAGKPPLRPWVEAGLPRFIPWLESNISEPDQELGSCKKCGAPRRNLAEGQGCLVCDNGGSFEDSFAGMETQFLDPNKPQYKVISQKDRFFGGKFDPAQIERALNEYAQLGWTVVSAISADIPGIGGARNELVIIMEKKPNV